MTHAISIDTDVDLPDAVTVAVISSLVRHVLASEDVAEEWQLGIRFVDDHTMQSAHAEFMGIDEPTDIMTFPYADEDGAWGESEPGGDLIISVGTAGENAREANWSLTDEIFFLVCHGLLHLLGWDDHTDEDRAAMLARQHDLLQAWPDRP